MIKNITPRQSKNWIELSEEIRSRQQPLGIGLKNQCFIGLAIDVAQRNRQTLVERFGYTVWALRQDVRDSADAATSKRNLLMSERAVLRAQL